MGFRERIASFLVIGVLTLGFLAENGCAFNTSTRRPLTRTQFTTSRPFAVRKSFSKQHRAISLSARRSEGEQSRFHLFRRRNQVRQQPPNGPRSRLMRKFMRAIAIMWTAALLWFGSVNLVPPPAFASTATTTSSEPITSRVIPKGASLDQIIDRYVKDHMFDEDVYDPVESTYIETYDDVTTGRYPRALNEVASSLLGSSSDVATRSEKASSENLFISALSNGSSALQKIGLSSTLATVIVYAATLVGAPSLVLIGILSYANAQKRMRIRQNKKRYGADYSLDATIKVEEDIEAPDDDEFDDDEDDDDEDDDDEDDEEDDDE